MSDNNNVSVLERIKRARGGEQGSGSDKSSTTSGHGATVHEFGKKPYRAFERNISGEAMMGILFHYSNGEVNLMPFGYIQEIRSLSPNSLAVIFTTGGASIVGRNLRELLVPLNKREIISLHPYNPLLHIQPDDSEPVIESLEFYRIFDLREEVEHEPGEGKN